MFAVNLLFESERFDNQSPLWEEKILLIDALDEAEAEKKAAKLAKSYECNFSTQDGEVVWSFHSIERTFLIEEELGNGAEIFSRFIKASEAKSLLASTEEVAFEK